MAHITADRVLDTSTTTGTSPLVMSGTAPTGYRPFSAVMSTSDTCFYGAQHETADEWETGFGTYSSTNTLTRTAIISSSNGGSAVSFSAGTKDVWIDFPASKVFQQDNLGRLTLPAGFNEKKTAPSISSNTLTLDCSLGNVFSVSLNANINTLSFNNVPATGTAYGLTLSLIADGTARTVTWGSSVKWPGGTAPTLTSTNGKVDTFVLYTHDGGTTWFAFTSGQNS
jgi:hypothetical protein